MRKNLFRRIFFLYTSLLLISLIIIEVYITSVVREDHLDNLRRSLRAQAVVAADSIESFDGNLDGPSRRLKTLTGARVTIIAADGRVSGDSDYESSGMGMENHADRPEIKMAAFAGSGWAIRHSDTLKYDLFYLAVRVAREDQTKGYVRLSLPLIEIERSVNGLRVKLILAVALVLLASGAFSLYQTGKIGRLTAHVVDFSRAIASGDFDRRLYFEGMGEFDKIAENLNAMSIELKSLAEADEEKLKRLRTIIQSIPDALMIIDGDGVIVMSNAEAGASFGQSLAGKTGAEVVRNAEFFAAIEAVRHGLTGHRAEFLTEGPPERHFALNVNPLMLRDGRPAGFVAVFHDITRIKRLEETRKDFVANVSHELKTPITAIRGFADTLIEGAIEDKENALKFLQTIKSNSERIDRLVDDLMTLSRIELGVVKIEKTEVDVAEAMEAAVMNLRDKASLKGIEITASVNPDAGKISADRHRLIQILTNLVDNAVKFTDRGRVTLGSFIDDGGTVLFVEDTGIGIPEKHLPRLGERFYRVDPSRSRAMGGTGLGLAIVKHLVKTHGWRMKIESTEGRGTKVKIFIA